MKKLIAILVVFAVVAGAAFAQDEGSWSVSSSGTLGTKLDFTPRERAEDGHVTSATAGDFRGDVGLTYKRGGLSLGLGFRRGSAINTSAEISGDNFTFKASGDLTYNGGKFTLDPAELGGTDPVDVTIGPAVIGIGSGDLWGNYRFDVLNGLKLQVSAAGASVDEYRTSDIFGDTIIKALGGNNLWLDVSPMDGLNVGFVLPNIFASNDFVEASLKKLGFGAKFSADALAVGFHFVLDGSQDPYYDKEGKQTNTSSDLKAGLYIGASYKISDEMSAGLEFRGYFGGGQLFDKDGNPSDAVGIKIGAKFDFSSGDFGAGVTIKFEDNDAGVVNTTDYERSAHNQTFAINPYVQYNLNPDYLQFKLEAGFTFKDTIDTSSTTVPQPYVGVIDYSFTPSLTFNFLGTGAGGWDTGFQVKYNVAGPRGYFEPSKGQNTGNSLEIVFKWKL